MILQAGWAMHVTKPTPRPLKTSSGGTALRESGEDEGFWGAKKVCFFLEFGVVFIQFTPWLVGWYRVLILQVPVIISKANNYKTENDLEMIFMAEYP